MPSGGHGTLHTLAHCTLTGTTPVHFGQVSEVDIDPGISELLERSGGQVQSAYAAMSYAEARMSFNTTAIAQVLTTMTSPFTQPIWFRSGGTYTGFKTWFRKQDLGGTVVAYGTSGHRPITMASGLLIPMGITADNSLANMSMMAVPYSDGITPTLALGSAEAITGDPGADQLYKIGPVAVGSTFFGGMQSLSIDFGIGTNTPASSGLPFATWANVLTRQASLTFETTDIALAEEIGPFGVAIPDLSEGTTMSFWLRKFERGYDVEDETATDHLKVVVNDGRVRPLNYRAAQDTNAAFRFAITPTRTTGGGADITITNGAYIVAP